jgi:hypothetical protein
MVMPRPRLRWLLVLAPAGLLLPLACSDLKSGEEARDGGAETPDVGDGALPDASAPPLDAGVDAEGEAPPPDVACSLFGTQWSAANKTMPSCAERRVFLLDDLRAPTSPAEALSLTLARSPSGKLFAAYNGITGPEEGEVRSFAWRADSPMFAKPPVARIAPTSFAENAGASVHVASSRDDTFHMTYQRDSEQLGGSIVFRRVQPDGFFSQELAVATAGHRTQLSLAVSPVNGDVTVAYLAKAASPNWTLFTKTKPEAGATFGNERIVQAGFTDDAPLGSGRSRLKYDASGVARIAYMFGAGQFTATPRYSEFASSSWGTNRKTLENPGVSGVTGYSIDWVAVGPRKFGLYFGRAQGATSAELRLASWVLEGDTPTIDVRESGFAHNADGDYPRYASAIDVDKFGMLHVAYIKQGPGEDTCDVRYVRQWRARASEPAVWLEDAITLAAPCFGSTQIDMVLDERARPHIVYSLPANGVYYATRFDR